MRHNKSLTALIMAVSIFIYCTISAMAMPKDSLIIGSRAYTLNAIWANITGLQQAMDESNNQYYFSMDGVTNGFIGLFDSKSMTAQQKKALGAMTLTDYNSVTKQFTVTKYSDFDTVETVTPSPTPTPTVTPIPTATPSPTPKPTAIPTPKPDGLTRFTPVGIDVTLTHNFKEGYPEKDYSAKITLTEIIRGNTAWLMVSSTNRYNDPAPEGKEYMLAKFNFELTKSPDQYWLDGYYFKLISETGKEYESESIVVPRPELYARLYQGASHEGYVAYLVDITDKKPVINFGKDYSGNGGVWYKAY